MARSGLFMLCSMVQWMDDMTEQCKDMFPAEAFQWGIDSVRGSTRLLFVCTPHLNADLTASGRSVTSPEQSEFVFAFNSTISPDLLVSSRLSGPPRQLLRCISRSSPISQAAQSHRWCFSNLIVTSPWPAATHATPFQIALIDLSPTFAPDQIPNDHDH